MAESEHQEQAFTPPESGNPAPVEGSALAPRAPGLLTGLPTGTGIGKYRILERIRNYHNAAVYKARDTMLDRLVAIKQMCPALIDNPIACGHFKREAQLLARIPKDSRHVLNVHELIEDEAGLFIVEEFIHGEWLESLISKRHIGVEGAVKLLKTAALGLRTLHQHQIAHRDVQPGNIMVTRSGAAKIANFASAAHEGDLSSPPVISPKYSAPELLLEKNYDNRVDIYSLGVVLFEVCVGRRAMDCYFSAIVQADMAVGRWMEWQVDFASRLPHACELNPLVPPELSAIIRQMTAKNLDERFTSMQEVLDAMAGRLADQPGDAGPRWAVLTTRSEPAVGPLTTPTYLLTPQARPAETPRLSFGPVVAGGLGAETPRASSVQAPMTNTQTVRPAKWGPAEQGAAADRRRGVGPTPAAEPPPAWSRTWVAASRAERGPYRHRPPVVAPRPALVQSVPIIPAKTERHVNRRRQRIIKTAAALLLVSLAGIGGYAAWDRYAARVPDHPIENVVAEAWRAFDEKEFGLSRQKFKQAASMTVHHPKHQSLKAEAERALDSLQLAAEAAKRRDYERAEEFVAEARRWGLSPARVESLQEDIWQGKDAINIGAAAFDALRSASFETVETHLDEYERKAPAANLDPGRLRERLGSARRETKHAESIRKAEDALNKGDYHAASAHCSDAEGILITSRTRDLRKRIMDAELQAKAVERAREFMARKDYHSAVAAYDEASLLKPTPEIETQLRLARAWVNFEEARAAIERGDLIAAEDRLRTALFNSDLQEAKVKLEKLRPTFEAARRVREADWMVDAGRSAEALKLYRELLPLLPSPADEHVRRKIGRAEAIQRADRAAGEERWLEAIEAYEEALTFGPDSAVQDRLNRAKARLPELPVTEPRKRE